MLLTMRFRDVLISTVQELAGACANDQNIFKVIKVSKIAFLSIGL